MTFRNEEKSSSSSATSVQQDEFRATVEEINDDDDDPTPTTKVTYPDPIVDESDVEKPKFKLRATETGTHALVVTDQPPAPRSDFASKISQQRKEEDHSSTAYISDSAPKFGSFENAPSAPPLSEEEVHEYENWLRETQLSVRESYSQHKDWHANLQRGGLREQAFNPVIAVADLPKDHISAGFKDKVKKTLAAKAGDKSEHELNLFLGRGELASQEDLLADYIPAVYRKPAPGEMTWEQKRQKGVYDEVREMIDETDKNEKLKGSYGKSLVGASMVIPNNHFIIVSDQNGTAAGSKYMIWGPGNKIAFTLASASLKMAIDKVQGSHEYELGESYIHVPERLTIVTISKNELGFCVNRATNMIYQIQPGRYFLHEKEYSYIGKVELQPAASYLPVKAHKDNKDDFITECSRRLRVVLVQSGNVAFVKDRVGTYVLLEDKEPYVLDTQRGEEFINFSNRNEKIMRATDGSYTVVNNILPGEYIVFRHDNNLIAWFHDDSVPQLNTVHLPSQFYKFDGKVYGIEQPPFSAPEMSVVYVRPNNTLVVKDNEQRVRFIEESTESRPLVFRRPWQFIDMIGKSQQEYVNGDPAKGTSVARVMPGSNDWVAVLTQKGRLEFFPSLLDGSPYYFYQPAHRLISIINKNKVGEQKLNVPGIGEVTILNITSGQIGTCRIQNMHFFLEARPNPYVLAPPNQFLKIIPSADAHAEAGDLHRIFLRPDEIAVVSVDGEAMVLPSEMLDKSIAKGNGVYVYRCFQFQIWGPVKKSDKQADLGPYHFFNVGVGEVGYGYVEGKLKIWKQGQHCVDNNKDEWFEGFYAINVDPVNIKDLQITSLHMITSHVDVYVSYSITDPEKAIQKFKDHKQLHEYIEQITRAEIMKLCAERPPIGYTDMDFDPRATASATKKTDDSEDIAVIVNTSRERVNKLLHQYGVDLSDIDITRWQLDKEFVDRARLNALKLQDQRAANEQAKMESEKKRIESEQQMQALENQNRMARKRLELEAETAVQAAENEAKKATAKQVAEARARKETAQALLDAAKLERAAKEEEATGLLAMGKAKAEIGACEVRAKMPDLTGDMRLELERTRLLQEGMLKVLQDAFKSNAQIPGVFTLDPQYLQLMMMNQMALAQQSTANMQPMMMAPLATNSTANRPPFLMWPTSPGLSTASATTNVTSLSPATAESRSDVNLSNERANKK